MAEEGFSLSVLLYIDRHEQTENIWDGLAHFASSRPLHVTR